jgi:hypothetical protein
LGGGIGYDKGIYLGVGAADGTGDALADNAPVAHYNSTDGGIGSCLVMSALSQR